MLAALSLAPKGRGFRVLRLHVMRRLDVALHEAAHVVVGVALGLRLKRVVLIDDPDWLGYAWFYWRPRQRHAFALMYAAGLAWDRALTEDLGTGDRLQLRRLCGVSGKHAVETHVRAASAILAVRGTAHARVTRALLERDLSSADVALLAQGEVLD